MEDAYASAHSDFLSVLSDEEIAALVSRAKRLELEKGQSLFRVGDPPGTAYIVAEGCIKLYRMSAAGHEVIFWLSLPGEIFGLAEPINGIAREISAEAHRRSAVLAITRDEIEGFFRKYPEASMRAIGILSARLRSLGHSFINLATDDVETRLVRLLLRLAAVSKPCATVTEENGICLNITLTHQEFANQIGASRQTVSSTLADLKRRGMISMQQGHMHIHGYSSLKRKLDEIA